jgi:hypothetical protein
MYSDTCRKHKYVNVSYRLCGLVVTVIGYRSGGQGSIPDTARKKVVGLERCPLSIVSTTEELLDRKVAAPVEKTENTAVGIRHADHVAPSIRKSWHSLRRQAAVARSVWFARGLRPCNFFMRMYLTENYALFEIDSFMDNLKLKLFFFLFLANGLVPVQFLTWRMKTVFQFHN